MHPLLAASLVNSFSNERVAAARTRRRAANAVTEAPAADDSAAAEVVIRRARSTDAPALVRLGVLDSDHHAGRVLAAAADEHAVLVAEVDGELEAAQAVDGGLSVANPFHPSGPHAQLLALRARQLGGGAPRRSRRSRLRVLSPHTS
jgi:hypothetical protein